MIITARRQRPDVGTATTMLSRSWPNRREAMCLLFGACLTHILSFLIRINTTSFYSSTSTVVRNWGYLEQEMGSTVPSALPPISTHSHSTTTVVSHTPGWTLFKNLYTSNGTFYIVTDSRPFIPQGADTNGHGPTYSNTMAEAFPELRKIISTGIASLASRANIDAREPREETIAFISTDEARTRWLPSSVLEVKGNTLLVNEPPQFLRHYYHFVAELFFGVQATWKSHDSNADLPPFDRVIFPNADSDGWRDVPGFNAYFLRGVFPSWSVEHKEDWEDRVAATRDATRVCRFPFVLVSDRSAANKGEVCMQTHRMASEAWAGLARKERLGELQLHSWWQPVQQRMWQFAGINSEIPRPGVEGLQRIPAGRDPVQAIGHVESFQSHLPMPDKIVISYISRQATPRRRLTNEAHTNLIIAIQGLVNRKNNAHTHSSRHPLEWEFNIIRAEALTKDEQVRMAARTTIMLGVHGNGLTHLVWMKPTRVSGIMEIFCPTGFAHDYWWTSAAIGIKHWVIWNDTAMTWPVKPPVNYPECFQGDSISVDGPTVAKLIEDRVSYIYETQKL